MEQVEDRRDRREILPFLLILFYTPVSLTQSGLRIYESLLRIKKGENIGVNKNVGGNN